MPLAKTCVPTYSALSHGAVETGPAPFWEFGKGYTKN